MSFIILTVTISPWLNYQGSCLQKGSESECVELLRLFTKYLYSTEAGKMATITAARGICPNTPALNSVEIPICKRRFSDRTIEVELLQKDGVCLHGEIHVDAEAGRDGFHVGYEKYSICHSRRDFESKNMRTTHKFPTSCAESSYSTRSHFSLRSRTRKIDLLIMN